MPSPNINYSGCDSFDDGGVTDALVSKGSTPHRGFARHRCYGWARLVASDGDGVLIREILRFFAVAVMPGEAFPSNVKECLLRKDLAAAMMTSKQLARAVDGTFAALLLPRQAVSMANFPIDLPIIDPIFARVVRSSPSARKHHDYFSHHDS
jgi:hypothetical protein